MKKFILFALLVDFVVLTVWVLAQFDYSLAAAMKAVVATPAGIHVLVDLILACAAACVWMYRDCKAEGRNPWPWIVGTALTGSPGPIAYLLAKEIRTTERASALQTATAP